MQPQAPQQEAQFALAVPAPWINTFLSVLGLQQFNRVEQLIVKIRQQIDPQLLEGQAPGTKTLPEKVNLTLFASEVNFLGQCVGTLSFNDASPILAELRQQVQGQEQAMALVGSAPVAPAVDGAAAAAPAQAPQQGQTTAEADTAADTAEPKPEASGSDDDVGDFGNLEPETAG